MNSDDPVAPYETLVYHGNSIKLDTKGKTVVVPTGNPTLLPLFNEYVENADRLTTAESPFGGMKGSYPPDYAVGTVYTPTEGIYLTDTSGTNSTKTLTAGKLKELNLLTVDTTAHTITEEFIVANTAESNNPTVIDDGSSLAGWSIENGTGALDVSSGVRFTGVGTTNAIVLKKSLGTMLANKKFIVFSVTSSITTTLRFALSATGLLHWTGRNFAIPANVPTVFVLPLTNTTGTGTLPESDTGYILGNTTIMYLGMTTPDNTTQCTFTVNYINSDIEKSAYIELQTPDNLAPSSLRVEVYDQDVSKYYHAWTASLDTTYTLVTSDSYRFKTLDGTSFNDIYGSWGGRGLFLKGTSGATVNGYYSSSNSAGTMTYSANQGTSKRIGLRVDLPPSDGGRTNFNKIRLKTILTYTDTVGNVVPDLSGNGNHGTIVGGVTKLTDGGLLADGSTGYVSTTRKLTVSNGITLYAQFKTSNALKSQCLFDCGGGVVGRNGVFVYLTSTGSLQIWITASGSATYRQADIVGVISTSTEYTLLLSWDGKIGTNNISVTLNGNTTTYSSDNTYSGESFSACTLLAYTTTPPNHSGFATIELHEFAISESVISDPRNNSAIHYTPTVSNMGSTTHDFADSTNASYGLHHMVKPWIALLEDDTQEIDFYLFDERPKNLKYKQDESGKIYELEVFPGNGNCYHGRIKYSGLTRDTNSDGIPDCLDASVEGSIANFLRTYDFAKDWYYEYDLSASAISANDFSITEESLDIVPFAVPEGDSVSDENNVVRPVVETVAGADGNISIYDVKGLDTVRVRDSPYTNAGECKVFDTVTTGNTNESAWVRVYTTDWTFTGDCVVENGLIRIKHGSNSVMYVYSGGSYVQFSTTGEYGSFVSLNAVSTDRCTYISTVGTVTLNRGKYNVETNIKLKLGGTTFRFVVTDNAILDCALATSPSNIMVDASSMYGYGLYTSANYIPYVVRLNAGPISTYVAGNVGTSIETANGIGARTGAIPYSQQMYWEAESLTGYGKTVVSDVDTYNGQAVEIRRPENYNNYITVNLTGMCVANQKIKIYVRAKCTLADKLQLYVHSTSSSRIIASVDPVLTIGSYAYYSLEFTPLSIDLGKAVNFYLKNMCDIGAEYPITVDYIVAVPTGLIETQAKRALWNASPMTSTLKSSKR